MNGIAILPVTQKPKMHPYHLFMHRTQSYPVIHFTLKFSRSQLLNRFQAFLLVSFKIPNSYCLYHAKGFLNSFCTSIQNTFQSILHIAMTEDVRKWRSDQRMLPSLQPLPANVQLLSIVLKMKYWIELNTEAEPQNIKKCYTKSQKYWCIFNYIALTRKNFNIINKIKYSF